MDATDPTLLQRYARYLQAHRLREAAAASVALLRAKGSSYAALFPEDRTLLQRQMGALDAFLGAVAAGRTEDAARERIQMWAEGNIPGVPATFGGPEDIVTTFAARKEALLSFVPEFTRDVGEAMAIVHALDAIYLELLRHAHEQYARIHRSDIERIEALDAALGREKSLLESIVDHVPAVMVYLDRTLVYRWANPPAAELLGCRPEDMVGQPLEAFFPQARVEVYRRALATGETLQLSNFALVRQQGEQVRTHYMDVAVVPIPGLEGQFEGLLVMGVEVTSRVENARLQQAQIAQLQELDRLKSDFINAASHELRTPLTSIMGYAEFLEDGLAGPLTQQQHAFLREIQAGTGRLQHLVEDLLDYARLEAGTFQLAVREADLRALLQQELSSLQPQAHEAKLQLIARMPDAPITLAMDPRRIGQVILNLVGNALKFTPEGGRVTVRLGLEGQEAVFAVTDTGPGIAPEHLPHLFKKFYQVDSSATRAYGGAGLGLAISRAIVEAHGGHIGVMSDVGEGSTFWFSLPNAHLPAEPARPQRAEPADG